MNPLLLMGLLSGAPGILSSIFGGDPNQRLRQQLLQLYSPANIGKQTNALYGQALQSPAFTQAERGIAQGANQVQGNIASSVGARGLGASGLGSLATSITPSIVGGQQSSLRSGLYSGAQQGAQNLIGNQANALMGTAGPTQTQQYFGAGLNAFMPFLSQYLNRQQAPGSMTAGQTGQGGAGAGGGGFAPYSPEVMNLLLQAGA